MNARWWHIADTRFVLSGVRYALVGVCLAAGVAVSAARAEAEAPGETTAGATMVPAEVMTTAPVTSREIGDGVWWVPDLVSETSVTQTLDDLTSWGMSNVYVCVFDSGYTLHRSDVFPPRPDAVTRDWLSIIIAEAHQRNIRVHAWVPVLYWPFADENHPALKGNPHWLEVDRDGMIAGANGTPGRYISPAAPEFRVAMQELLAELCEYPLDGIHLDALTYNASRDTGYHPVLVREFRGANGDLEPADLRRDDSPGSDWMKWVTLREDALTSTVQVLSGRVREQARAQNRRILVSASVTPGYESSRGLNTRYQYWTAWLKGGLLDFVTPQCFENDLSELEQQLWEARNYYQKSGVACVPGLKIEPAANDVAPTVAEQKRALGNVGFQFATIMDYTTLREAMQNEQAAEGEKKEAFWKAWFAKDDGGKE